MAFSASFTSITSSSAVFSAEFTGGDSGYTRYRYVLLEIDGTEYQITSAELGGATSTFSKTITGLSANTNYSWTATLGYIANNVIAWTSNTDSGSFRTSATSTTWSISSNTSWGTLSDTKTVSQSISRYTLYRYKVVFAYSGTATCYTTGSFDTKGYLSTSSSYSSSSGLPTSILYEDNDSGDSSNFSFSATVTAGTTYYLFVRHYSGASQGTTTIVVEPPAAPSGRPQAGTITSVTATDITITLVGSEIANATYYQFAIKKGTGTTYYHEGTSPIYTFTSLDQSGTIPILPATSYTVNYRGMNDDESGVYGTQKTITTSEVSQGGYTYIHYNGSWKKATPYIYSGGWKKATPYIYSGGWKQAGG